MTDEQIKPLTVSQCISADYCRGWNDAVKESGEIINRQKAEIAKKDKLLEIADKMQKGLNKQIAKLRKRNDELNELNKRAYQKFADRLYKKLGVTKNYAIDEVLREMGGDDNG